jgi:hypothetical protein
MSGVGKKAVATAAVNLSKDVAIHQSESVCPWGRGEEEGREESQKAHDFSNTIQLLQNYARKELELDPKKSCYSPSLIVFGNTLLKSADYDLCWFFLSDDRGHLLVTIASDRVCLRKCKAGRPVKLALGQHKQIELKPHNIKRFQRNQN